MTVHKSSLLVCAAMAAACWKSPRESQRDYAQTLRPARIGSRTRPTDPVRTMLVRAYAAPDYQAQTPRWNDRIRAQITRASAVVEADLGVRLELESIRTWQRADRFENLESAIRDLAASDPASEVEWVIGFAPALSFASAAHEQLGLGALFGRHLVLRGMFSLDETRTLEAALDKLPAAERDDLLRERRVHKETATLLHEWAHTLGAFHERVPGSLMSPLYEPSHSGFSEGTLRLLNVALEQRRSRELAALLQWAAMYRDEVVSSTGIWDEETRAAALRAGEQFFGRAWPGTHERAVARAAADDAAASTHSAPANATANEQRVAPADAQRLDEAARKAREGDLAGAGAIVSPIARRYPEDARVQAFSCSLAHARDPRAEATFTSCRSAARVRGAPPEVLLLVADVLRARGDQRGAVAALARAESALGDAGAPPELWLSLAHTYGRAEICSGAERAAARARGQPGAREIAAECARIRRRAALPPDASVPAEREQEYVAAVMHAVDDARGGKADLARNAAADLTSRFPGAPGAAVVRCVLHGRARALAEAKTACEGAAQAAPEAFLPRYLLGLVAGAERRWRDAQAHLLRALELDDTTYEPWFSLAAVQQALGDATALQSLKALYRKRFGTELHPRLWPAGWDATSRR